MKHLKSLRRKSNEEKKIIQQLAISILGIISFLIFIIYLGFPVVIKVSSFIAGFKKENILTSNNQSIVIEPFLDPLPATTNSARINISGNANEGETVVLYINNSIRDEKIIGKDGHFNFDNISLEEGENQIYTISKKDNQESQPSKKINILFDDEPPKLEIETPKNNDIFKKDSQEINIVGRTNEEANLFINNRSVIVNQGGNFSTKYKLSQGENKLEIKAVDPAGNIQTLEINVTYEP